MLREEAQPNYEGPPSGGRSRRRRGLNPPSEYERYESPFANLPRWSRKEEKYMEDRMNYDRLKELNRELNPPSEWEKERGPGWSYGGKEGYFSEGIADGGYVGRRPGHYAHGGYASRGTVAGELPRYGNMSVREEGETMGELSKRHRDQDWYSRMSGGLGSLGPRRRVA